MIGVCRNKKLQCGAACPSPDPAHAITELIQGMSDAAVGHHQPLSQRGNRDRLIAVRRQRPNEAVGQASTLRISRLRAIHHDVGLGIFRQRRICGGGTDETILLETFDC